MDQESKKPQRFQTWEERFGDGKRESKGKGKKKTKKDPLKEINKLMSSELDSKT